LHTILRGLIANASVECLVYERRAYSIETPLFLLQLLLKATTSIQRFELAGYFRKASLALIAHALINSRSVTALTISGGRLGDAGSAQLLHDIIQRKRNLVRLEFEYTDLNEESVLDAVASNDSLRTVQWQPRHDRHRQRLRALLRRNAGLAAWIENPAVIPQYLWPQALVMAVAAGSDLLYQSVKAMMTRHSEEIQNVRRGRKRKRPRYFVPS